MSSLGLLIVFIKVPVEQNTIINGTEPFVATKMLSVYVKPIHIDYVTNGTVLTGS